MDHNFTVLTGHDCGLSESFFGKDQIWYVNTDFTVLDALVKAGIFSSKGQARKNWKGPVKIPEGWSAFERIGKLRHNIYILNPVHDPDCPCPLSNIAKQAVNEVLDMRIDRLRNLLALVQRNRLTVK